MYFVLMISGVLVLIAGIIFGILTTQQPQGYIVAGLCGLILYGILYGFWRRLTGKDKKLW